MEIFCNGLDSLLGLIRYETETAFDGAEEIGSSDISCVVRSVLRHFYSNPEHASPAEFDIVRNGVRNAIHDMNEEANSGAVGAWTV